MAVVSGKELASLGSSLRRFDASLGSGPSTVSCSKRTSSRIFGWRESS
jgi:hypothetical protein